MVALFDETSGVLVSAVGVGMAYACVAGGVRDCHLIFWCFGNWSRDE